MVRVNVESTNIHSIEYSDKKQELKVWFNNRKEDEFYLYSGVPPKVFGELMLAKSKGRYFADNIKLIYDFKGGLDGKWRKSYKSSKHNNS